METDLKQLADRLAKIEVRNNKVETNKAWETSWSRRGLLALFTYLAIGLYLAAIKITNPWLNAIVPTVGFLLSTLTLPFFKKFWEKYIYKSP